MYVQGLPGLKIMAALRMTSFGSPRSQRQGDLLMRQKSFSISYSASGATLAALAMLATLAIVAITAPPAFAHGGGCSETSPPGYCCHISAEEQKCHCHEMSEE